MIQGIQPGPQLITEHADLFWGLIASFWIGNVLLVILNVPLIGLWVKVLQVPYRYMFPCAMFFIAVGVYSTNNSLFEVNEVLVFGVIGAIFMALDFPVAPILLGYVLGPLVEENFRRALLLSRGDLTVFFQTARSARPSSPSASCWSRDRCSSRRARRTANASSPGSRCRGAPRRSRSERGGAPPPVRLAFHDDGRAAHGCSRNAAVDRRGGGRRPCLARGWLLLHGARPMLEYRAC